MVAYAHFSLIIPTLDRSLVLQETLDSIFLQNLLPEKIYVIDQSEDNRTQIICKQYLRVKYIHIDKKSGTAARNIGIKESIKDGMKFWIFLDDDVDLDPNFFQIIHDAFVANLKVVGIMAWIRPLVPHKHSYISNILRFLGGFDYCTNGIRMRRNFLATTLWHAPHKMIKVEWMPGGAMAVRNLHNSNIFFDENLILYAQAEDRDFSYRLSLLGDTVILPHLQLLHKAVPIGRIKPRKKIFMAVVHQYYLMKKNFGNTVAGSLMFWWNMLMRYFVSICISIKGLYFNNDIYLSLGRDMRDSVYYVASHRKQLQQGDLNFFHQFLLSPEKGR